MPKAQKPSNVGLRFDEKEPIQPYFANCFNVAYEDGFFRVNLAFRVGSQILKAATVVAPKEFVFANKTETVEYFNNNPDVSPSEPTSFMAMETDVFFGFIFAFSRNGHMGEINPIFFRLNSLPTAVKDVQAFVNVSLNTPIAVQFGIIKAIYIDQHEGI